MKKIAILGGTKYVGKDLVLQLKKNYEVFVLSRTQVLENDNFFIVNREDEKKLEKILVEIQPDIIIDMICYSEIMAKSIVSISKKLNLKHYIMISSFFVYNYSNEEYEQKIKMDFNNIESDNYTKNKVLSEQIIYNSDLYKLTTIVRFPFIFSHDDCTNRFQNLIESVISFDEISCDNYLSSFISKRDAVNFLENLVSQTPLGFVDPSSGSLTLEKIIKLISTIYNIKPNIRIGKNKVYYLNKNIVLNSQKLKTFNFNSVEKEIRLEIEKYRMS